MKKREKNLRNLFYGFGKYFGFGLVLVIMVRV